MHLGSAGTMVGFRPIWVCFVRAHVEQFEDFRTEYASKLLERYRYQHLCFNDDIQVSPRFAAKGFFVVSCFFIVFS